MGRNLPLTAPGDMHTNPVFNSKVLLETSWLAPSSSRRSQQCNPSQVQEGKLSTRSDCPDDIDLQITVPSFSQTHRNTRRNSGSFREASSGLPSRLTFLSSVEAIPGHFSRYCLAHILHQLSVGFNLQMKMMAIRGF